MLIGINDSSMIETKTKNKDFELSKTMLESQNVLGALPPYPH